MNRFLSIEKKVSIGELFTFLSIVASSISVITSWSRDREIKLRENANNIRIEISQTLNTINQVVQLQLSFYDLIETDIVETSELAIYENSVKARDYLWKRFFQRRNELRDKLDAKEWEINYIRLLPYGINIDSTYTKAVNRLTKLDQNIFNLMLLEMEKEVLNFSAQKTGQTALLTNALRRIKRTHFENHRSYATEAIAPLNDSLRSLLRRTDRYLLQGD